MILRQIRWYWMGVLGLLACDPNAVRQGQPSDDPATQPITQLLDVAEDYTNEIQEKGLPDNVESWVDDLIVTLQPGSNMPEIYRMKEGERAEYLHQRTLLKREVQLRGQRFKERYILIRTRDGQLGWVNEAGVKYVYPRFQKVLDQVLTATNPNQRTRGGAQGIDAEEQRLVVPGQRVGPIRLNTSEMDLIDIFGPVNIAMGKVETPTGPEDCTVVFPGESEELKITWTDDARTKIKAVYIDHDLSPWFTREGLSTGLMLPELVKVNQGPLTFYGLDWDYSGVVDSWKNGALARHGKHFYVQLAREKPGQVVPVGLKGDKLISSNESGLAEFPLKVARMVVYLD